MSEHRNDRDRLVERCRKAIEELSAIDEEAAHEVLDEFERRIEARKKSGGLIKTG